MTDFLSKVIDWDINGNPLCTYEQQIRSMFGDLAVMYVQAAISHTQDQFSERINNLQDQHNTTLQELSDAQEESNCAEAWLDHYSCMVDIEQTHFDCLGDYVRAVCEGYEQKLKEAK